MFKYNGRDSFGNVLENIKGLMAKAVEGKPASFDYVDYDSGVKQEQRDAFREILWEQSPEWMHQVEEIVGKFEDQIVVIDNETRFTEATMRKFVLEQLPHKGKFDYRRSMKDQLPEYWEVEKWFLLVQKGWPMYNITVVLANMALEMAQARAE